MYSSLQKIDIVTRAKDGGAEVLIQTDHRRIDEVAADVDVSVLFALTRILAPQESKPGAQVRYVALGGLHPVLARVIASTGAEAEALGKPVDLSGAERVPPADLADQAFASLGKQVLARHGVPATEAGLIALEKEIEPVLEDEEDGEIPHWTQVVEIAAAAGEVLRALHGGRWVTGEVRYATIPFMFQVAGDTARNNVVGKTEKFLQHGESEAPHHLLRAIEDRNAEKGPLLISLKSSRWGGVAETFGMFLPLENAAKLGADLPWMVFGNDQPQTFAMMMKKSPPAQPLEELKRQALANLEAIQVQIQRVDAQTLTFFVVHGSYFASEKILDERFLKKMHAELGAKLLLAAVPEKSRLFLADATKSVEATGGMLRMAQGVFDKNEGGRQISPTVFLISEGRIVGVATSRSDVSPDAPPDAPKKKGLFSRLFGN